MNSIILTGGTSKRFGSDKSQAIIANKTLLEILTEGLSELIIVGPETSINAKYVREEPQGSGPVAAIGAGLKEVDSELVAIFATDMPFASRMLNQLERALIKDAAIPVDCDGFAQPLAAVYRTEALNRAISTFETLENKSMKELISKLDVDLVPLVETELLLDIDTKADLEKAIDLASRLAL
jgi:molybdopterin-guanine dinucleotide biosynthesis protein A